MYLTITIIFEETKPTVNTVSQNLSFFYRNLHVYVHSTSFSVCTNVLRSNCSLQLTVLCSLQFSVACMSLQLTFFCSLNFSVACIVIHSHVFRNVNIFFSMKIAPFQEMITPAKLSLCLVITLVHETITFNGKLSHVF